jgi:hypothetical protein
LLAGYNPALTVVLSNFAKLWQLATGGFKNVAFPQCLIEKTPSK